MTMPPIDSMPFQQQSLFADPFEKKMQEIGQSIGDSMDNLMNTVRHVGMLTIGGAVLKDLLRFAAGKFFEVNILPAKLTYVDWWPYTQQKVYEVASQFWSRRGEGATLAGCSSSVLLLAGLFSNSNPAAQALWNLAGRATKPCLNLLGFTDKMAESTPFLPFVVLPSAIGIVTSIALGTYDLIRQCFDRDLALEIKPVFHPTLQAELGGILSAVKCNKEGNDFFQNLLLYGPPGTGKTMISKWIAAHSKMNYVLISGGDLLKTIDRQIGAAAAVYTLQKLVEHAKSLSTPTIVFVDEAEACFGTRESTNKSQELISLLNAFLHLTGQPSSKLMWILATNRPKDIDPAVLSRMDYKIKIASPEFLERKAIIKRMIDIVVTPPENRPIFTAHIDYMAKQTEGFSGRDIFKLINRLKTEVRHRLKRGARLEKSLNPAHIDRCIKHFVRQEQEIDIQDNGENPLKKNPFYRSPA